MQRRTLRAVVNFILKDESIASLLEMMGGYRDKMGSWLGSSTGCGEAGKTAESETQDGRDGLLIMRRYHDDYYGLYISLTHS